MLLIPLLLSLPALGEFTIEDHGDGRSMIREDGQPVLVYNWGDQCPEGIPANRTRSCYIHPLHGLDGEVLTDDFPSDHLHHRGVSMMWPGMKVGTRSVDHWHIDGIRTINRDVQFTSTDAGAEVIVMNNWVLDDGTIAAEERNTIMIAPAGATSRTIDITSKIIAGSEPITLRGAALPKGYGGHMIRLAPRTGEVITTDRGTSTRDSDRLPFRWADYSATFQGTAAVSGVALFPHPDHPDYAPYWQIRPYGILSMSWPGSRPHVIEPGASVTLAYRMLIHRGDAAQSDVAAAWRGYVEEINGPGAIAIDRRIELFKDAEVPWTVIGTAQYDRQDGQLHGHGNEPRNSFLVGPTVADFEFETEFKVEPGSNSGIQIRSAITPKQDAVRGYQIEIDTTDRAWTGGLYDELRRGWLEPLDNDPVARGAMLPARWNHLRIVADGPHLRTWVNGIPALDAYDATDLEGILAFQVHGGQCDIRWRNAALTPLGRHRWTPLWDGTSLDGWRPSGGGTWRIEDGVLVGRQQADDPEHGHLFSTEDHEDFTVRIEFMSPAGNSGLYFRAEQGGRVGILGFQAEIDGRSGRTGGLYETGGRQWVVPKADTDEFKDVYKPGEWNTMTVTADGPRIVVHVNGTKTADITDPDGRRSGPLALQLHGAEDMELRVRTIELLVPDS
jgi:hypothetical protein